jgi:hypothetical protein
MKKFTIFSVLAVALGAAAPAFAVNYYVSPVGADTNSGSIEKPWKTISYATCGGAYGCPCTKTNPSRLAAGDTLFIRAGEYHENTIGLTNSGTSANRIVIKSYPDETATINGDTAGQAIFNIGRYNGADWIVFDSLKLINGLQAGILLGVNTGHSDHIVIQNCRFENIKQNDNTGHVQIFDYAHNDTIRHCVIVGSGKNANLNYCGIQLFRTDGSICIDHCEISKCAEGIFYKHCSIGDSETVIKNCFIHDNSASGLVVSSDHLLIKNNLLVNNGEGCNIWVSAGAPGGSFSRIEHNTVYGSSSTMNLNWVGDVAGQYGEYGPIHDTLQNNIFYGTNGELGSCAIWPHIDNAANRNHYTRSDYNCYYNTAATSVLREFNSLYTLSRWHTNYPDRDGHSVQEQPAFADKSGAMSAIEDFKIVGGKAKGGASDGSDIGADVFLISGNVPAISIERAATVAEPDAGISVRFVNGSLTIISMLENAYGFAIIAPNGKVVLQRRNVRGRCVVSGTSLGHGLYFVKVTSRKSQAILSLLLQD